MRTDFFTVRVDLPGEPQQIFTTIAGGPISAVSAVTRDLATIYPASALKRARFACRSGCPFAA